MKFKLILVAASISALLVTVLPAGVLAQSASGDSTSVTTNSNSMRISPVRTDIAMDPGTTKELTVYIQNMSAQAVQAKAIVSDFEASTDESGKPSVILEEDRFAPSHSLKRLSKLEPSIVTLTPSVRIPVKVTISVPQNAKAGGYYGAVRFLPVADLSTGDGSGVAISTNLGSLVLLRVNGELEEKLSLASMDIRQKDKPATFFNSPDDLKVRLRFKNDGNIQLQPFGKVRVLDRNDKVVEEHEVNNTDPRGNVLPTTIRRFEVDLKKVGSFGKYTIEGNFGYGTGGELITTKQSFWVVPTSYIIGGIAGLLFLGGIGYLIFKVVTLSRRGRGGHSRRY